MSFPSLKDQQPPLIYIHLFIKLYSVKATDIRTNATDVETMKTLFNKYNSTETYRLLSL